MSYLIMGSRPLSGMENMHGMFSKMTDVFGKRAKESRKKARNKQKHELEVKSQEFEQKRTERQDAALDAARNRLAEKLEEVEAAAGSTTEIMDRIRRIAGLPVLANDEILEEIDTQLADLEVAIVGVQAGTVASTASFDEHTIAVGYADAQAALIAMNAIRGRAHGIYKKAQERVRLAKAAEVKREEDRLQALAAAEREKRRMEFEAAARELAQKRDMAAEDRRNRMAVIRQSAAIDDQIMNEKRELRRVLWQIEDFQASQQAKADAAEGERIRLEITRSSMA